MSRNHPDGLRAARGELLRFLTVGGLSSLSYALIMALVLRYADAPPFTSGIALFCLFIPVTFQAHKRVTFVSRNLRGAALPGYALLQVGCFTFVSAASAQLVTGVYLLDTALYLTTVVLAAALSFLVGKYVIFRPRSEDGQ